MYLCASLYVQSISCLIVYDYTRLESNWKQSFYFNFLLISDCNSWKNSVRTGLVPWVLQFMSVILKRCNSYNSSSNLRDYVIGRILLIMLFIEKGWVWVFNISFFLVALNKLDIQVRDTNNFAFLSERVWVKGQTRNKVIMFTGQCLIDVLNAIQWIKQLFKTISVLISRCLWLDLHYRIISIPLTYNYDAKSIYKITDVIYVCNKYAIIITIYEIDYLFQKKVSGMIHN